MTDDAVTIPRGHAEVLLEAAGNHHASRGSTLGPDTDEQDDALLDALDALNDALDEPEHRNALAELVDYVTHQDYPAEAFLALLDEADGRFREQIDKYGPGQNWRQDDAAWLAWNASDKALCVRDVAHGDSDRDALTEAADALNYLAFAIDTQQTEDGDRDE